MVGFYEVSLISPIVLLFTHSAMSVSKNVANARTRLCILLVNISLVNEMRFCRMPPVSE